MPSTQSLEWRSVDDGLAPFLIQKGEPDRQVEWAAQPGSQAAFLDCPVFECLLEGNRGGGKTESLLMDFAQHVGQGYGRAWRGILFRRTYPELEDVMGKAEGLFSIAFPDAKNNLGKSFWEWPTGEKLFFRQFIKPGDYWKYHGHGYPWIAWEELTNWPSPDCYKSMFSCCRSPVKGIPKKVRATTNPYGVGHSWVKHRFRLPFVGGVGPIIRDSLDDRGKPEPPRVAIHSALSENKVLLAADPHYIDRIAASANNPEQLKAWIDGSWDIVAGGMFDDLWNPAVHMIEPFAIPDTWTISRSFDWGSSKPFSVGWWAESDGCDAGGRSWVRGDLIRIGEWYGWAGKPNVGVRMLAADVAKGIIEREEKMGIADRVGPGPADSSIFDEENGNCIATDMQDEGVIWMRADKRPGSRKHGWEQFRKRLQHAKGVGREEPGLFIFSGRCEQFKRTVPVLPRCEKDLDDVDTEAEDHIADEARYMIRGPVGGDAGVW
ncbi:MAG: terminase [Geminicoccaceae bacterium]